MPWHARCALTHRPFAQNGGDCDVAFAASADDARRRLDEATGNSSTAAEESDPHGLAGENSTVRVAVEVTSDDGRYAGSAIQPASVEVRSGSVVEVHQAGVLSLSSCHLSVREDAGGVLVDVVRLAGSSGPTSARFRTLAATASEADFAGVDRRVEFADGETVRSVHVGVVNDTAFHDVSKSFFVELSDAEGAATLGRVHAEVEIIDDEDAGVISFEQAIYEVSESAGTVELVVRRSGGDSGEVRVSYASRPGSAGCPLDFAAVEGELVFGEGETRKSIAVTVHNDTYIESPSESFVVSLSNARQWGVHGEPGGSGHIGAVPAAKVVVLDDGDLHAEALAPQADRLGVWREEGYAAVRAARTRALDGAE